MKSAKGTKEIRSEQNLFVTFVLVSLSFPDTPEAIDTFKSTIALNIHRQH